MATTASTPRPGSLTRPRVLMTAIACAGTAALTLTACTLADPSGPDAGSRLLHTLPDSAVPGERVTVNLADVLPHITWDTFATVCPYESPELIASELGIPARGIPDLSQTDQYQAVLLLHDGDLAQAAKIPRGSLDLCPGRGEEFPTLTPGTDLELTLDHDERWVLTAQS